MFFPGSVRAAAARIGVNYHLVSFFFGPALYCSGDHLVPGKDYFTQYGIGQGFAFSFFLQDTARATVESYICVAAGICWAFYVSAYFLLRRFLGSRPWALGTTVTAALLAFHASQTFSDPSSWPIRFPLLCCFVWLVVRAAGTAAVGWRLLLAGACAGLAIFWNTETGLSMLGCGAVVCFLAQRGVGRPWLALTSFLAAAATNFLASSLLAYGGGVFSERFLWGLYKPLLVYGGGFAAEQVNWNPGWNYLYALSGPLLGVATAGWCVAGLPRQTDSRQRQDLVCLLLFSLLGICFLLKWINQSIDAVWMVNAFPLLVVGGWWLRQGFQHGFPRGTDRSSRPVRLRGRGGWRLALRPVAAAVLVGAVVCYLWFVQDRRNPTLYAVRAFWDYPSVGKCLLTRQRPRETWQEGVGEVPPADVALIQRLTAPGERVAIFGDSDWVYLLAARRVPKFHFLPSTFTFLTTDFEESLADAEFIFVQIGGGNLPPSVTGKELLRRFHYVTVDAAGNPSPSVGPTPFGPRFLSTLERPYMLEASGSTLAAYRRSAPSAR
jgi:hypothetical protein